MIPLLFIGLMVLSFGIFALRKSFRYTYTLLLLIASITLTTLASLFPHVLTPSRPYVLTPSRPHVLSTGFTIGFLCVGDQLHHLHRVPFCARLSEVLLR